MSVFKTRRFHFLSRRSLLSVQAGCETHIGIYSCPNRLQELTTAHLIEAEIPPLNSEPIQEAMSRQRHASGEALPVAELLTVDVSRLQEEDEAEAAKVFQASMENGAFYLDFSGPKGLKITEAVADVFALSKELFRLSTQEKMTYDIDLLGKLKLNGYLASRISNPYQANTC